MTFCNIQYGTYNIEIVYRDYWKNVITKSKIYFPRNSKITYGTHQSKLLCINETGKYLRVEILNLDFSIKKV